MRASWSPRCQQPLRLICPRRARRGPHPQSFDQGLVGGATHPRKPASAAQLHASGASLAARALAYGTLYAVGGCGIIVYAIWKLSGAENLADFRRKAGSILPVVPKNYPPQSRTEFSGLNDFLQYVIDQDREKKAAEAESNPGSVQTTSVSENNSEASVGQKKVSRKSKKLRFKRPRINKKPNPAQLPQIKGEASSNWKVLQASLPKSEGVPRSHKRKADPEQLPGAKRQQLPHKGPMWAKRVGKPVPEVKAPPNIWFDDVDEMLLDPEDRELLRKSQSKRYVNSPEDVPQVEEDGDPTIERNGLVKEKSFKGLTKVIAIDCEMVGVGFQGKDSILARVSIVNHFGHCIYDKYVKPREKVTNYRTAVSGIRPEDLENGADFMTVQTEVSKMFDGRVLVGHAIHHDMKVLLLAHPKKFIRDTSAYKPFRNAFHGRTPSLKNLTSRMLGVQVQEGEHSSVQDAQATMRLYTMFRKDWEKAIKDKRKANQGPLNTAVLVKAKVAAKPKPVVKQATTKYADSDSE
eukprot:maker-scaffold109_size355148-snap-gene-1.27 protein:Tk11035 transcript:maker-scaffold109_size355148-snap-gene-1.27-mRNA-1 annotation:"rna exonuclease 4"